MKKKLLHLEKTFIFKNKYSHYVIKQILTQLEKEQERNNGNNNSNNNNYRNTNNGNSFTKEKNSHMSKKQVSFIRLDYQKMGRKVKKLLNPSRQVYINLYQITQKKKWYIPEQVLVLISKLKIKQSLTIKMV